jgi:hypothetical protein
MRSFLTKGKNVITIEHYLNGNTGVLTVVMSRSGEKNDKIKNISHVFPGYKLAVGYVTRFIFWSFVKISIVNNFNDYTRHYYFYDESRDSIETEIKFN